MTVLFVTVTLGRDCLISGRDCLISGRDCLVCAMFARCVLLLHDADDATRRMLEV